MPNRENKIIDRHRLNFYTFAMAKLNSVIRNIAFYIRLEITKRKLKKRINKSWDIREKAAIYLEDITDKISTLKAQIKQTQPAEENVTRSLKIDLLNYHNKREEYKKRIQILDQKITVQWNKVEIINDNIKSNKHTRETKKVYDALSDSNLLLRDLLELSKEMETDLEESTDKLEHSEELLLNYNELGESDNLLEIDKILNDDKEK
jgi:hypothetical protein